MSGGFASMRFAGGRDWPLLSMPGVFLTAAPALSAAKPEPDQRGPAELPVRLHGALLQRAARRRRFAELPAEQFGAAFGLPAEARSTHSSRLPAAPAAKARGSTASRAGSPRTGSAAAPATAHAARPAAAPPAQAAKPPPQPSGAAAAARRLPRPQRQPPPRPNLTWVYVPMPPLLPHVQLAIVRACDGDRQAVCSMVPLGGGRVIECLARNEPTLAAVLPANPGQRPGLRRRASALWRRPCRPATTPRKVVAAPRPRPRARPEMGKRRGRRCGPTTI